MNNRPSLPPLLSHPFAGPWLENFGYTPRMLALERYSAELETELGRAHPDTQLALSWRAVSWGAELFNSEQLAALQESEPYMREHFPEARWALAMNLAAQGCHTWFLQTKQAAIPMLAEAHEIMFTHCVGSDGDVVKVAEVLASCLAGCGRIDEAVQTLHRVAGHLLAATEQSPEIVSMYEELFDQLTELHHESITELATPTLMRTRASVHLGIDEQCKSSI